MHMQKLCMRYAGINNIMTIKGTSSKHFNVTRKSYTEFSLIRLVILTWLFYVRMDELNGAASLNESSLIDDTFLGI